MPLPGLARMLGTDQWPWWLNAVTFAAAAGAVWLAGTRLAGYVDDIARLTGLGQAFVGMLLLGGITSLPEIATVATSAVGGQPALAINNLLGSASINVVLLAAADAWFGRSALTSFVARPATLFQGTFGVILLAVTAAAIAAGDVGFAGIGVGAAILFILCGAALWMSAQFERRHVWTVVDQPDIGNKEEDPPAAPLSRLVWRTVLVAAIILGAGVLLSETGDGIAKQSGLGTSLIGLVLVGFATSLPELSTITAAVRRGRHEMAIGDIFGTNLFNIGLIFVADVAYRKGPVLAEAGRFEIMAALVGVVVTSIIVLGILERTNRTVLRMGYDSLAVLVVYLASLPVLWMLAPR